MLFRTTQQQLAAGLAAVISIVVYLPSIWADFTYDDKVAVKTNPDVQLLLPPSQVFKHDFWGNNIIPEGPGQWTHHSYRPLVVLTFQLDQLLGGGAPAMYHLSNILVHALVTVLCGSFMHSLWGIGHFVLPFCATLLFALHPVHTEVVANVTSRAETVAAIFMLYGLARIAFRIRSKNQSRSDFTRLYFLDIVLPTICAVLCKEVALVFPLVALWVFCMIGTAKSQAHGLPSLLSSKLRHCDKRFIIMCMAFTMAVYFVRVQLLSGGYDVNAAPVHNPIQFLQGLAKPMSYAYVQALAMSMTIFPWFLAHEHNALPPLHSASDPRNLLTLGFWMSVAFAVFWIHRCTANDPLSGHQAEKITETDSWDLAARFKSEAKLWSKDACEKYSWSREVGCRCLLGLGIMALFYAPASHILVTVAFVLAERTLFLPTIGSVIVLTEVLALAATCIVARTGSDGSSQELAGVVPPLSHNLSDDDYRCNLDEMQPLDEVLTVDEVRQLCNRFLGRNGSRPDEVVKHSTDLQAPPQPPVMRTIGPQLPQQPEPLVAPTASSEAGVRFAESVIRREAKREERAARRKNGGKKLKQHAVGRKATPAQENLQRVVTPDHNSSSTQALARNKSDAGTLDDSKGGVQSNSHTFPVWRVFAALVCIVLTGYTIRLHTRQMEWQNEDVLLQSCYDLYPENNFMTVYGIGTRKLYSLELQEAERLLLLAHEMSPTIAEPLVLLSQLYWKYGANVTANGTEGNKKAIHYLTMVQNLNKRNEFQTNLGLLLSQQATTDKERNDANRAVLYAAQAHTLRPGARMLGPVLHNAACVRMLAPHKYGNMTEAQALAERAAAIEYSERGAALHNLAVIHAVQGHAHEAQRVAKQAQATGFGELARATSKLLTPNAQAIMQGFAAEHVDNLAGSHAAARLTKLGTVCASSMLWF